MLFEDFRLPNGGVHGKVRVQKKRIGTELRLWLLWKKRTLLAISSASKRDRRRMKASSYVYIQLITEDFHCG